MKLFGWLLVALVFVGAVLLWPLRSPAQTPSTTLEWTAPGDDGNVGTAALYEARRSTAAVGADTLAWWNAATPISGLPLPAVAGTRQSFVLGTGLLWNTTYYFIIRARDDGFNPSIPLPGHNWSGWSNVAVKVFGAQPDTTAPARVFDLIAR